MDWLWPLLAAPFIGSFLAVLIRRLPRGALLTPARSSCEACGAPIGLRDLVPLLSALVLRGRCRACQAPIPPQHWHVEAAAILVPASALLCGTDAADLWPLCLLGWCLLALAWIDWDWLLLPDLLTLPLVLVGLAATWARDPSDVTDHAIAAAAGYAALQLLALGYRRLRGREGIGAGDAKLLAAIGAWTGLAALPWVIMGGALAGLVLAGVLLLRGQDVGGGTALPFGTCLALAGWAAALAMT
jgi:leader peptidase (prepilin peptidase)/N-methyltransferase